MNTSKIIKAYIGAGTYSTTEPITQGDYGYILQIEGAELPATYRVDFANNRHKGEALPVYGNENGVEVPEELIATGKDIFAFYYYIGENFGKTVYTWKIPNDTRANAGDREPTPTQQDSIDQLIVRSNEAVERAEQAKAGAETAQGKAEDAQEAAETAQRKAEDAQGASERAKQSAEQSAEEARQKAESITGLVAEAATLPEGSSATAYYSNGTLTLGIPKGDTGDIGPQGIQGPKGDKGDKGDQGIQGIQGPKGDKGDTGERGLTGPRGPKGDTGATGSQGPQGIQGERGLTGETGATPNLTIGTVETLDPTDDATATITGTPENPVLNLGIPQGDAGEVTLADLNSALIEKAPIITDTASGSIASFSDGADNLPLKSLVVDINPVQDLHGQDSPYPAGGGKNKFDPNSTNHNWAAVDGTIFQRDACKTCKFPIASGASVTLSNANASSASNILLLAFFDSNDTLLSRHPLSTGATYITATAPENTAYVMASFFTWSEASYAQLELGSTATAWSPYENICPISGHEEVNVYDDPLYGGSIERNQYVENADFSNGLTSWFLLGTSPQDFFEYVTAEDGIATVKMIQTANNTQIQNACGNVRTIIGHKYFYRVFIKSSAWATSGNKVIAHIGGYWARAITESLPVNEWIEIAFIYNGINATNPIGAGIRKYADENYSPFQIKGLQAVDLTQMFGEGNEPSTVEEFKALFPNDYYPYSTGEKTTVSAVNGKPYTHINISLGQTVYGGKLDVLSGVLTVDRAMVDLGTLNWGYEPNYNRHGANFNQIPNIKIPGGTIVPNALCSKYKIVSSSTGWANRYTVTAMAFDATFLRVYNDGTADAEIYKIAMSGVQLVYELATPIEIQLSPNRINSLYGVNNLWADSGDAEVEYRADTKLFIERLTAPDSADMIADANITSGQYFMVGNSLYKATANIANGSAIIVGTNCTRKSLSEALNEINA